MTTVAVLKCYHAKLLANPTTHAATVQGHSVARTLAIAVP